MILFPDRRVRRRPRSPAAPFVLALLCRLTFTSPHLGAQTSVPGINETPWLVAGPFGPAGETSSSISPLAAPKGVETWLFDDLDRNWLEAEGQGAERPGEGSLRPGPVQKIGEAAWRQAAPHEGSIDFAAFFASEEQGLSSPLAPPPAPRGTAYAYREFDSTLAREVALKLDARGLLKVWFNGELLFSDRGAGLGSFGGREGATDRIAARVNLLEGRNRVLVKLTSTREGWSFRLRLRNLADEAAPPPGTRIEGLRIVMVSRNSPSGGAVDGFVVGLPAFSLPGKVRLSLLDRGLSRIASLETGLSTGFSLALPPGFSGPATLRAEGLGALAGLSPGSAALLIGDPSALAAEASSRARALAEASGGGATRAPESLVASSLFFHAALLSGEAEPALETFDSALDSLGEIEVLAAAIRSGRTDPASPYLQGSHRLAFRSPADGRLQPFSLYLPPLREGARRPGLLLALPADTPGGGRDDLREARALSAGSPLLFILVPRGRTQSAWNEVAERDLLALLDLVMTSWAIDPDLVHLSGDREGADEAWRLAQLQTGRFASAALFGGSTGTSLLENLRGLPLLVVQGGRDQDSRIDSGRRAVARLAELGAPLRFDLLPASGTAVRADWFGAAGAASLLAWLGDKRRDPWPLGLDLRAPSPRDGRLAWAAALELTKALRLGALRAEIVDTRHLRLTTENLALLELDLRHPALAKGGRILVNIDGYNLTADAGNPAARFRLGEKGRFVAIDTIDRAPSPNPGVGLPALYDRPLLVVYGTRDPAATASLRAQAELLALGRYPVLPDLALSGKTAAAVEPGPRPNLLLVGSPAQNLLAARLAPSLALPVGKEGFTIEGRPRGDAGLVELCPNPEAPEALVCLAWIPLVPEAALDFARDLVAPLRDPAQAAGPGGWASADLLVVERTAAVSYEGSFDRDWKVLRRAR